MRWRTLTCLVVTFSMTGVVRALPVHAAAADGPCSGSVSGDFNGDGEADLAIGVPDEDLGGAADAGAVNVIYGSSAAGLTAADDQFWHQDAPNIEGGAEAGDRFGACLATGDFDGDGADDLAVGAPGEDVGAIADAGAVNVLHGSLPNAAGGLTAASGDRLIHQNTSGVQGNAEAGDAFGGALASGDFNNDGREDLAVGAPLENIGSIADAGAVNVLRGSSSGVSGYRDQLWHQNSSDVEGVAEADDKFGAALATGDFNNDGRRDLAIGSPEEDIGAVVDAGSVSVLYGSATLLVAAGDQLWAQNTSAVGGTSEANDLFGRALATGNFNGDAFADLAVGVPLEDVTVSGTDRADAGVVNVLYGAAAGLSAAGSQMLQQSGLAASVGGTEADDRFGSSLAAGTFDSGTTSDLAIGAPFEDTGISNVGAVDVIYGSAAGLAAAGGDFWTQLALEDEEEADDAFGSALTAGDFDDEGTPGDLAIGAPLEDLTAANAGAVNVVYGTATGLSNAATQLWHQDITDIEDVLEANDMFGSAAG